MLSTGPRAYTLGTVVHSSPLALSDGAHAQTQSLALWVGSSDLVAAR
jgi:hypothetical protein